MSSRVDCTVTVTSLRRLQAPSDPNNCHGGAQYVPHGCNCHYRCAIEARACTGKWRRRRLCFEGPGRGPPLTVSPYPGCRCEGRGKETSVSDECKRRGRGGQGVYNRVAAVSSFVWKLSAIYDVHCTLQNTQHSHAHKHTHTNKTTHSHEDAPLFCHRPSDRGTLWRCTPPLGQSAARRRRPAMLCERKRRRRHIASQTYGG